MSIIEEHRRDERALLLEPQVVLAGSDLDAAAERAARGCFRAAGEAREVDVILVHADVHDAFIAKLKVLAARRLRALPGDAATRLGRAERAELLAQLDDAWTRGATIDRYGAGDAPITIVIGVTTDMQLARSKLRVPIAPIVRIASGDEVTDALGGADGEDPAADPPQRGPAARLIVPADADLDAAAERAARGCFRAAGEARGVDVILVHADVHDAFVAKLKARAAGRAARMLAGDKTPPGSAEVVAQLDDAWTRGAIIDRYGTGELPATVVTGVTTDMQLAHSKLRAPIAPVMRIASRSERGEGPA